MSYRNDMREVHKEARWTVWKFSMLFVGTLLFIAVVFFGLRAMGLIGETMLERKVFEESFQYSEARKSAIAAQEATMVEIERKLMNPNLDDSTRYNLEAQLSAIRIRISTERNK